MSEGSFRTILFVALLLVAPTLIFLVQVVFIVPPVLLLAGLVFLVKKIATSGFGNDNLVFFAFLAIHLVIYGGLYWLISWLVGKLASLFPKGLPRTILLLVLLAGLAAVTQVPIYGGAGHGPADMGPLQHLLARLEKSYGAGSVLTVYLTSIGLVGAAGAWRWWRKRSRNFSATTGA